MKASQSSNKSSVCEEENVMTKSNEKEGTEVTAEVMAEVMSAETALIT